MTRQRALIVLGVLLALVLAVPALAGTGGKENAPGQQKDKTPKAPITLNGTIEKSTVAGEDGKEAETRYTLVDGGKTYNLEAGPRWFFGRTSVPPDQQHYDKGNAGRAESEDPPATAVTTTVRKRLFFHKVPMPSLNRCGSSSRLKLVDTDAVFEQRAVVCTQRVAERALSVEKINQVGRPEAVRLRYNVSRFASAAKNLPFDVLRPRPIRVDGIDCLLDVETDAQFD